MINLPLIYFGKLLSLFIKTFRLGGGSTWPGHIALKLNPSFNSDLLKGTRARKIVIAGTNGKTTTGKLIGTILSDNDFSVAHNSAGANLINGLASTLILNSSSKGILNKDVLIFESDENAFSNVVETVKPDVIILLNLFRDQMDRYGEIDTTARKWRESLLKNKDKSLVFLNADDPSVSYLGKGLKQNVRYFGLNKGSQAQIEHGADSIYCPKCYSLLYYNFITFSHLGDWYCSSCGEKRPKILNSNEFRSNLVGEYNKYNVLAAALVAKELGLNDSKIKESLKHFKPAFGRQEQIYFKDRRIQLFLSKNPTSFNESLRTIRSLDASNLLVVLNDRIPDGLDVSWIWDIDTSQMSNIKNIMVSGDREFDMALRLRYSGLKFSYERDLRKALFKALNEAQDETLFVLPTYSAMLDIRKIIKGRKLL